MHATDITPCVYDLKMTEERRNIGRHEASGGGWGCPPPLFLAATIILDLNMKNIIIMELAPNFLGSM